VRGRVDTERPAKSGSSKYQSGAILIIALWSLAFLVILAAQIGLNARSKISLLSRLEKRNELPLIAESGIRKAIAVLHQKLKFQNQLSPALFKKALYNNPEDFGQVSMGNGFFEVGYSPPESEGAVSVHGLRDEERKINVNKADRVILQRLIEHLFEFKEEEARKLAEAIVDWHEYGTSEIVSFYSDDYYDNLKYPYPIKGTDYERIEELRLLWGMNEEIYRQLASFLTVYGEGHVNINTASAEVLAALGFSTEVIHKLLLYRWGPDGAEATEDDVLFKGSDAGYLQGLLALTPEEVQQVNEVIAQNPLSTESRFFMIDSLAKIMHSGESYKIRCVYDTQSRQVVYWREKVYP
jgi:DNA uptake protein ComE-like DNA-binding protein